MAKRTDNRNSEITYMWASYKEYAEWNGDKAMKETEYWDAKRKHEAKYPEREYYDCTMYLDEYEPFYVSPYYEMNYLEQKWERVDQLSLLRAGR